MQGFMFKIVEKSCVPRDVFLSSSCFGGRSGCVSYEFGLSLTVEGRILRIRLSAVLNPKP